MSNYQNRDEESESLLISNEDVVETHSNRTWATTVVVIVVTLLFGAVAVTYKSKNPTSSTELLGIPNRVYFKTLAEDAISGIWNDYKLQYGKTYGEDEEPLKLQSFKKFLTRCDERNLAEEAAGGSAKHGLTKFSDMSEEEFSKYYLGYRSPDDTKTIHKDDTSDVYSWITPKVWDASTVEVDEDVTEVNWSLVYTTTVNNQGFCGSCWAFSTVEQIESDAIRAGLIEKTEKLSYQQVVSCDQTCLGCDGGDTGLAYMYVNKVGGLVRENDYSYDSRGGHSHICNQTDTAKEKIVTVDDYYTIASERDMKTYIRAVGPISVCLDASTWSSYTGGIVKTCGTSIDHCVQAVGLNVEGNYWIVRNSWGTDWGEHGYIYLEADVNLCGIKSIPTFTKVSEA